jgi:hypothetical protein
MTYVAVYPEIVCRCGEVFSENWFVKKPIRILRIQILSSIEVQDCSFCTLERGVETFTDRDVKVWVSKRSWGRRRSRL